jgi:biofilm PGA synthesis protein PgaD
MNEQTLILTEHRMLPRIFDGILTAIAWGGFIFFLYANLLMQFTDRSNDSWDVVMASFNTVLVYLLVAALNGWLLILWYQYNLRRYNARRHGSMASLRHEDLAESFNIAPQIISEMSQYNLLTVYHDHIGRIIELKTNPDTEDER